MGRHSLPTRISPPLHNTGFLRSNTFGINAETPKRKPPTLYFRGAELNHDRADRRFLIKTYIRFRSFVGAWCGFQYPNQTR